MLRFMRHCVAALLTVALTAQLVEARAVACVSMEMSADASMNEMPGMSHYSHERETAKVATREGPDSNPESGDCILKASCVNSSAVPMVNTNLSAPYSPTAAVADIASSASSRTPTPDFPPPRA